MRNWPVISLTLFLSLSLSLSREIKLCQAFSCPKKNAQLSVKLVLFLLKKALSSLILSKNAKYISKYYFKIYFKGNYFFFTIRVVTLLF